MLKLAREHFLVERQIIQKKKLRTWRGDDFWPGLAMLLPRLTLILAKLGGVLLSGRNMRVVQEVEPEKDPVFN